MDFDVVELAEIVVSSTPNEILFDFPNSGLNCLIEWPGSVLRNGRRIDVHRSRYCIRCMITWFRH